MCALISIIYIKFSIVRVKNETTVFFLTFHQIGVCGLRVQKMPLFYIKSFLSNKNYVSVYQMRLRLDTQSR